MVRGDVRDELLRWLEERKIGWVVVDAPKVEGGERPADARRDDDADRLRALPRPQRRHVERARRLGRQRFDHLYSEDELREWVAPLRELSNEAEEAYAFFNNNNQTNGVAQAPAGAQLLRKLLEEENVPTA